MKDLLMAIISWLSVAAAVALCALVFMALLKYLAA